MQPSRLILPTINPVFIKYCLNIRIQSYGFQVLQFQYQFYRFQISMQTKKSKNRYLGSSKKNKKGVDSKILKIYGFNNVIYGNSTNKSSSKSKNQAKYLMHCRQAIETYDFPQFSISYHEPNIPSQKVYHHNKDEQIIVRRKERQEQRKRQLIIEQERLLLNREYYADYILTLSKIFKMLDLFNRGTITQTNLTHRIPEAARAFLSRIFDAIKEKEMTLTERQFIKLCQPLLKQSSIDNTKQFLQIFLPQNNPHISCELKIQKADFSPIQNRMTHETLTSNRRNNNLAEIIGNINQKEKEISNKLKDIKQRKKAVSFNLQKQNNEAKPFNACTSNVSKSILVNSTKRSYNIDQQPASSFKEKAFNKITAFEVHNKQQNSGIDSYIPNISQPHSSNIRPNIKMSNTLSPSKVKQFLPINDPDQRYINKNITSARIMPRNSMVAFLQQTKNTYNKQSSLIDDLNSKLDQYLKRSQSKIQKSKLFLLQNSGYNLQDSIL